MIWFLEKAQQSCCLFEEDARTRVEVEEAVAMSRAIKSSACNLMDMCPGQDSSLLSEILSPLSCSRFSRSSLRANCFELPPRCSTNGTDFSPRSMREKKFPSRRVQLLTWHLFFLTATLNFAIIRDQNFVVADRWPGF